jgi:predicted RNase H-like HicB family nuclease
MMYWISGGKMSLYDLRIVVEELEEGGDYRYLASSPDLPGLLVAGDSPEEVLSLAPDVAAALIASLKAAGDVLPDSLRRVSSVPFEARIAVGV